MLYMYLLLLDKDCTTNKECCCTMIYWNGEIVCTMGRIEKTVGPTADLAMSCQEFILSKNF